MDKFKLTDSFVEGYKNRRPPFGFNGLGELVYYRTYSRQKPDGSNEQWYETCRRVVEGTYSMQKKHIDEHGLGWNAWKAQGSAREMYDRMFNMKFLPPGRGLWAMGSPITEERGLFAALNNCAFVSTSTLKDDLAKPFMFLMDMSMLGVGVGFDTAGAGQIVIKSPNHKRATEKYVIPDTREGWVESVRVLIESYFLGTAPVEFDYALIRKEGEPIKGFGGISAGAKPLIDLHENIVKTLEKEIGSPISITAIVDLQNHIGKAVVAGNVRRTAEIVFGDPNNAEYLDLKNYEVNPHREEFGWTSNNSVFAKLGMKYDKICERIKINGEPGIAWLENMKGYSRMNNGPDNKDHRVTGGNPCLVGDTLIAVADGRNAVAIKDLVGTIYPVYSTDENGKVVIKLATKTWKTGNGVEVWKLTLDDGSTIIATPNHEMLLRNGKYKALQNLIEGDSLMPFNSYVSNNNYRQIASNTRRDRRQYRMIAEYEGLIVDPKSTAIHHSNFDSFDDQIINLVAMSHKDHHKLHSERMVGAGNPMRRPDVVAQVSKTRKRLGMAQGENNGMFGKTHSITTRQLIGEKSKQNWEHNRTEMVQAIRYGITDDSRRKLSESRTKGHWTTWVCPVCGSEKELKLSVAKRRITCSTACSNKFRSVNWNHKVIGVEFYGYEDVYDITVEDTHNFGVISSFADDKFVTSSGVFVHNCLEQSLESYELCCLVEVFPSNCTDMEDYLRTIKFAYLYAKTVTLGKTHWAETNRVMLRNRRIGCSIGGIQQFVAKHSIGELKQWLEDGYKAIEMWDKAYSDWLAIPLSKKTTSEKPSGSISLLVGALPGMHWPKSRFYIRRVRLSKFSDMVAILEKAGYTVEPCYGSEETTVVVEFPIDVGAGVRTLKEVSMWEQLSMAAFIQKYWADNQVSCTVNFNPETEGDQIEYALDYFQYQLKGISFLPDKPEGTYRQMPYEEITESVYKEHISKLKKVNFVKSKDTEKDIEKFCDGDSCLLIPQVVTS